MWRRMAIGSCECFTSLWCKLGSIVLIAWGCGFLLLEIIGLMNTEVDPDKITLQLCFIPSQILVNVKVLSLIYYGEKYTGLLRTLKESSINTYVDRDHIITTTKRSILMAKIYMFVIGVCVTNICIPALELFLGGFDINTNADKVENIMLFVPYTPFEMNTKFRIVLMIIYQILTLICGGILTSTSDSTAASILMRISTQFVTVQKMMANIHSNAIAILDYQHNRNDRYWRLEPNELFEEWMNRDENVEYINRNKNHSKKDINYFMRFFLRDAIKLYGITFKCSTDFEYIYRYGLGGQVITSTLVICMAFYQLGTVDTDGVLNYKTTSAIMLMMVFTLQLGLYIWNCDEITVEAEKVAVSAWCGNWYYGDVKFRRDVTIAIAYTQQPRVVKTFSGLVPLSNQTFVEIYRRAYSVFALLKSYKK